ncbi:MAG: hypothetical protein WCF82_03535 [Microcoleus sp.]
MRISLTPGTIARRMFPAASGPGNPAFSSSGLSIAHPPSNRPYLLS